jgi:hypothetical protein
MGINPRFKESKLKSKLIFSFCGLVIVAFRGTKSLENWISDLNVFSSNKAFPWKTDAQGKQERLQVFAQLPFSSSWVP